MSSLPVEVLLGIYLGLLTGIVPAFVAGALGFLVRYVTGVTLPGFGVVVLALAIASINGGLLILADDAIINSPRLLMAVLVVLMLALYAHSQGDKLGAELPRRVSFTSFRKRTLSADVVEFVGTVGQVTVRPGGEVRDMEGYPPLPQTLRTTIRDGSWRLPADLPLSELEVRLEERLRTDHDLADVSATIDEQGRATIAAAPPSSGLSRRVPEGRRAVSIDALVPTGLSRSDAVRIVTADGTVSGTVLSARGSGDDSPGDLESRLEPETATDGGVDDDAVPAVTPSTATTAGGEGRVTVAVSRRDARTLLSADRGRIVVQSRGTSHEFEALSLLGRTGQTVRRVTVGADPPATRPDEYDDVTILAVRRQSAEEENRRRGWVFAPGIERRLEAGDDVFVAGSESALDRFVEETR
ncbi:potassium transporter TrkA [Halobacteria archaeon AArc-m2/3/4]|uniref:Potassium transporter TrkA n=1 Tax=Natronoglomus mannanivorans TaxID=2979990 RepID=A0ABT2QC77_9EURY|nr:potassium transporter TrkA [Halobacteria archaeon AArc-m2/3/4]